MPSLKATWKRRLLGDHFYGHNASEMLPISTTCCSHASSPCRRRRKQVTRGAGAYAIFSMASAGMRLNRRDFEEKE